MPDLNIPIINGRKGDWMETFTGKKFFPFDPRPEEIDIEDIAHALSLSCRYGGHSRVFYSVAQHSVYVADAMEQNGESKEDCFMGLLHDASEAYISDIPRPLKQFMPLYKEFETSLMHHICSKFNIKYSMEKVAKYDDLVLNIEGIDLMHNTENWAVDPKHRLSNVFVPWDFDTCKAQYLSWFNRLKV